MLASAATTKKPPCLKQTHGLWAPDVRPSPPHGPRLPLHVDFPGITTTPILVFGPISHITTLDMSKFIFSRLS